jgi:hypothetical protein
MPTTDDDRQTVHWHWTRNAGGYQCRLPTMTDRRCIRLGMRDSAAALPGQRRYSDWATRLRDLRAH